MQASYSIPWLFAKKITRSASFTISKNIVTTPIIINKECLSIYEDKATNSQFAIIIPRIVYIKEEIISQIVTQKRLAKKMFLFPAVITGWMVITGFFLSTVVVWWCFSLFEENWVRNKRNNNAVTKLTFKRETKMKKKYFWALKTHAGRPQQDNEMLKHGFCNLALNIFRKRMTFSFSSRHKNSLSALLLTCQLHYNNGECSIHFLSICITGRSCRPFPNKLWIT